MEKGALASGWDTVAVPGSAVASAEIQTLQFYEQLPREVGMAALFG